ncbi:MAG: NosD domain-containing protein [Methanospirillum sp.]
MARSLLFSVAVVGVLLFCCLAVPAAATNVTYTGQKITIAQPGTYVLTNDITNSSQPVCIEIQASNVIFDGGGHLIDGLDSESTAGIYVHGPSPALSGVTIRNVRVEDWYYGVYLHETANSRLEASTLSSNGFCGAVLYKNAVGNTITGNTIAGSQYGVIVSDGASGGVVANNVIRENGRGLYLYLSNGTTVRRNVILDNSRCGIQVHSSGGGTVYDNRLDNTENVVVVGEPVRANAWSVTPGPAWTPANIIGGPKVGGNYWARPDHTGFSQTNPDANGDGFIDSPLTLAEQNVDAFPLAAYSSSPSPSRSGNGTFWLEQTTPAEEGRVGVATLYLNSTWELPVEEIRLNLTWDGEVLQYAGTDWMVGGSVSAEPAGPAGLTLRMTGASRWYPRGKTAIAEISFECLKAGSSSLPLTIGSVSGHDELHGTVPLPSATAEQGTFVVGASTATPTATETVTVTPTPPSGLPGLVVPGGVAYPTDPDADDRYEDVNGNGKKDYADLVLLFTEMTWIQEHEARWFDFNENGRIDFGDVVWLYNTFDTSPNRTFTVTAIAMGPGRIAPSGEIAVPEGGNITFNLTSQSALPAPHDTQSGYLVDFRIFVDPSVTPTPAPVPTMRAVSQTRHGYPPTFTLRDVRSDHTVYAWFYYFVMYA